MIRIFTHYVSAKTAFLFSLEALILMLAVYAGASLPAALVGDAPAIPFQQLAVFPLVALMLMASMGLYQLDIREETRSVLVRMLAALLVGFLLALLAFNASHVSPPRPDAIVVAILLALAGTTLVRIAFYRWGDKSAFKERVLVLGTGSRVAKFAEYARRSHSHEVVRYVALQPCEHFVPLPNVLTLAPGESLLSVVEKFKIDRIVIAIRDRRGGGLPIRDLLECRLRGINVTELPTFFEREYRQVLLESINPSWMVFGDGFSAGCCRAALKRAFDLAVSLVLLLLALPVMVVTALCILLESGRPLLYRQERVGQGGRVFTIYKFRSMRIDAERDGTPRWAAANDDRTTRVGRIIRKLRIDELPQIINVLKGDMSFVGPRPERPFFVDKLVTQIPYYASRHRIKPGITGWAQVNYPYGATLDDTIKKLQYDLYYLKNHGLFLDLMILFATVEVVLWGKGAR